MVRMVSGQRTGAVTPLATRPPDPLLRGLLARDYAQHFLTPDRAGPFVLPASVSVTVVVKLEHSALRPAEFVQGVQSTGTLIEGGCAPSYIEFALTPLGAYALLGTPMNHLAGRLVDLREIITGTHGRALGDTVRDASTLPRRFDVIDRFLLDRLATGPGIAPEVRRAWERLIATGGRIPIRAIRDELGWSHKHLITRFTQQVGLTPKRAARVIRFEGVRQAVDQRPDPDWGALAARFGYADQAHLVRDFHEFTGATPTAYLARRPKPSDQPATRIRGSSPPDPLE
jgi:AraC-like DNA-binding protein